MTTSNERPYPKRVKLAQAIIDAIMDRTVFGSFRISYTEGRDADLCRDLPYHYAQLSVIIGEERKPSQFVCSVDLLNPDKTEAGITQLVTYGLLPAYFDPKDIEEA